MANLFTLESKFWPTLGAGLIGTLLATVGIYNHIIDYIVLLGAVIIPLAGILIADYQFFREKYRTPHQQITKEISIPAMVGWIAGFLVAKFTTFGSPAINALLVSGALHVLLSKSMGAGIYEESDRQDRSA